MSGVAAILTALSMAARGGEIVVRCNQCGERWADDHPGRCIAPTGRLDYVRRLEDFILTSDTYYRGADEPPAALVAEIRARRA